MNGRRGSRFGLGEVSLLLSKYVHCRRIQDVIHYPNPSEEPSDTVTNFRSHVLAQQLSCVRIYGGHVPIELGSEPCQKPLPPDGPGDLPPCYPAW